MWFTVKTAFIKKKKKKKKKKSLPTLPNIFEVVRVTHIFLFGPTKHAKQFDPVYLTRTILRHWKLWLFLLCIKLKNEYIFKPKCNCRRKSMQEKEPHNGCLVQIESPVTQGNYLASLGKPRDAEQLQS